MTHFAERLDEITQSAEPLPVWDVWAPFPGPQTVAYEATEYEVFYGGAKGPGKSDWILYGGLSELHKPKCKILVLRESFPEIQELMDRAHTTFPKLGLIWRASERRWEHPVSGGVLAFGYCSTIADVQRYQGQEWAQVRFDEWANLPDAEAILLELAKEIRCPNPDVRRQIALSGNPGYAGEPDAIRRYVGPCGEQGERVAVDAIMLPDGTRFQWTRRFVPGRVTDNPIYAHDPTYMATLVSLPYRRKQQLLFGKWGLGGGRALDELDEARHIVPPFPVPSHWTQWGSFDWGFGHPFCFMWFARDEDGKTYLVDSVHGHRLLPWEQADRIKSKVPATVLRKVAAGHDCWAEKRAMGENTPTIAQTFAEYGILLHHANIDRKQGLNNFREYVKWRGEDGEPRFDPTLKVMDTDGNRQSWATWLRMTTDPRDQEDALKRDADQDGENGDDAYDCARYGLAEWMMDAKPPAKPPVDVFAPETLAAMAEANRKVVTRKLARRPMGSPPPTGIY